MYASHTPHNTFQIMATVVDVIMVLDGGTIPENCEYIENRTAQSRLGSTRPTVVQVRKRMLFSSFFVAPRYEGGGLYRHVNLVKASKLHIAEDGVFAYSNITQQSGWVSN